MEIKKHLNEFFTASESLKDFDVPDIILEKFANNRVVFCTMGKSAFACRKVIFSALSFGILWNEVDVFHAFHGDAGLIKKDDFLVFVSKSGETHEVIKMANHFKDWDTLSITSEKNSSLSKICKRNIHIPVSKEGSPFDLAPMISTTLYMLVLHAILCDTVKRKKIKFSDFAKNHPAGTIGTKCNNHKKNR